MNHDELRDHYELYAIGAAEEPERTEIRDHLRRGCEVCMTEMKRAREFVTLLWGSAAPMAPQAMKPLLITSSGLIPKNAGRQTTISAILPSSSEPM